MKKRPFSVRTLHLWMGLPLWVLLFFICATGTLAVVSYEITWLFNPASRASGPVMLEPEALVASIEEAHPHVHVHGLGVVEPYLNVMAYISTPEAQWGTVWVDASTGAVSEPARHTFRSVLRALHGWLLMPVAVGWYVVCLLAVPLLISLVTGVMMYRRFWQAFTQPRLITGKGSRALWGSLHRIGGMWSLWFGLLISISSIWFLVMMILWQLRFPFEPPKPPLMLTRADLPVLATGEAAERPDLNQAMGAAHGQLAGLSWISLPSSAFEPVRIGGSSRTLLLQDTVSVNPYTGEVMEVRLGGDQSGLMVLASVMRALHVGNFGGLWIKLIWFAFGCILSGLIASGMWIWWKRTTALQGGRNA